MNLAGVPNESSRCIQPRILLVIAGGRLALECEGRRASPSKRQLDAPSLITCTFMELPPKKIELDTECLKLQGLQEPISHTKLNVKPT